MIRKPLIIVLLLAVSAVTLFAQKNTTVNWFGYIRSAYTYSIVDEADNTNEFNMLLTTLGLMANINEYSQVFMFAYFDASALTSASEGTGGLMTNSSKFASILDAEMRFKPVKGLQLTMGQFVTPFATEHLLSASKIDFVNRGYVVQNSPAYRDVGAYLKYSHDYFTVYGGVVNGSGMNQRDANNHKNLVARVEVKPIDGLFISGATSIGKDNNPIDSDAFDRNFYAGNISYKIKSFFVTAEASIQDYDGDNTTAMFAHAFYDVPVDCKIVKLVTPAFRYDFIDPPDESDKTDRMTFGLTLNFDKIKWLSHFRLNYEMISSEGAIDPPDNIIAEFQMRFD